ncbi:MAG: FAD-binding oxidoreductase [Jiangellaceae bacterium]
MPGSAPVLGALRDVVGPTHVLDDPSMTRSFTTDWTGRWRGDGLAVLRPGSTAEVADVIRICSAAGVGVVPQGGNTGLVGGSVPHDRCVLLSLRRLDRIDEVDPIGMTIAAGAGVTVAAAHRAAAQHRLALGVDLASRDSATLGGIVATNAGGVRVVRHGPTRRHVVGIEAVLADGSVLRRWTGLEKDNVGYDLPGLFAGSEGTLGVITSVLMRLVTPAAHVQVLLVAVGSLDAGLQTLTGIRRSGLTVEAAEFFQQSGLDLVCARAGLRPPFSTPSPTYLLVEVSGTSEEVAAEVLDDLGDTIDDAVMEPGPGHRLWAYREGHTEAIGATSSTPPVKLDVAVPLNRLAAFEAALRGLLRAEHPGVSVIIFGHIAEGNVHVNLLDVLPQSAEALSDAVLRLVAQQGGSISAEHGIGRAKLPWLPLGRSPVDIATMRAIKTALDPAGILNPGTLLDSPE